VRGDERSRYQAIWLAINGKKGGGIKVTQLQHLITHALKILNNFIGNTVISKKFKALF
jgi:hypothetical protein